MMVSASPSPRSPELNEKTKKYDRQLRLWGDHGQKRLEKSHVCLINANATGTEILKSLVLPGIGTFTIVDGCKVTQDDIGNNFFLAPDCLGKSRGECASKLLLEMNPDVNGEAVEESLDNLLDQNPTFFNRFTVVIGCQLREKDLMTISQILWQNQVPFLYVNSIGFLGWMRLQVNEHAVIESHPDSNIQDLRLDVPFPELSTYMDSCGVGSREEAMKTPWLVLMYKAIHKYLLGRSVNNSDVSNANTNGMDTNSTGDCHPCRMKGKEKQQFKQFLRQYLLDLGLTEADEEFDEVMKAANTALTPSTVNTNVEKILSDPKSTKPEGSKFWLMCGALKEFIAANNGQLPVSGTLPDMIADSDKYIALQNVYREKALKDAEDILARTQQLVKETGAQGVSILEEDARVFCRESHNLRVIRGYSVQQELNSAPTEILNELAQNTEDADQEMVFYIVLRGLLRFESEYKTYPGLLDRDVEPDVTRFKGILTKLLNDWNSSVTIREDCIHEMCRYGACELPSVAAFIGGCAAQEVIKLITKQYIPLDNTFIYNGIQSTSSSFKIST